VEGTFTNYQRRVQRVHKAVPPPGDALAPWELAEGLLARLGKPLGAATARDLFNAMAASEPLFAGLDYRGLGGSGKVLPEKKGA
jgi:predicted molibdopterin-dependent oxidoreductase YjgC